MLADLVKAACLKTSQKFSRRSNLKKCTKILEKVKRLYIQVIHMQLRLMTQYAVFIIKFLLLLMQ
jgi:hypothetical protein